MDDTILAPSHCNHLPCFNTVPTTMVIQEVTRPINRETGHKGFASRDPNFEDLIGELCDVDEAVDQRSTDVAPWQETMPLYVSS